MINKLKNNAGPTSAAESITTCQRFSSVSGVFSICLCIFSIITIAPSVIAPIAIAIPPSDMILAFIPCQYITTKAVKIPIGRVIMATIDERIWNKNTTHTKATTINSSINFELKLSSAWVIRFERSYTGMISTPSGRPFLSDSSFSFTSLMVASAFSPKRITTTPPVTSPSPFSSAIPRRICGPSFISATSRNCSGVPLALVPSGMASKSATLLI